ncbi:uncharacterized protein J4E79_010583 [Alternaria viburni]|uniref:uncharacterized protein n=1 Tax=Alternaria viburni TaxID=566460 RepID=UPI0020C21E9F|nr:uncharacterized protein J4E79_010583 [Alternaria viburni]KAI4646520.1 hypothetical protein J4E79_010583 [Alternaria viburni]
MAFMRELRQARTYPDVFKHARRDYIESAVSSPRQVVKLSDTPTIYSSEDMQLFHHYLVSAHPWIPHDWEELWVTDVPAACHKYPYLMDAMLALAGSHLAVQVENPQTALAVQHRQKAIVGLEDAFASWPPTAEESYIMLATSYLLCFQSSYIGDGFLDHFLSLRGCSFLSQLIIGEGFRSPFSTQKGLDTIAMDTAFTKFPEVDQELLQEALLSLKSLSSIMDGTGIHSIEKAIVGQLTETLRLLLHSDLEIETDELPIPRDSPLGLFPFANPILPQDFGLVFDNIDWENVTDPLPGAPYPIRSFAAMMVILTIFSTWPHEALMRMFDRTNQLGNVVMAHFCAVRFILSSLAAPKMALKTPTRATVQWNALIMAAIDDDESGEWTKYVEWPRKILRSTLNIFTMLEALVMAILRFLARILLLCINFWTFITDLPSRCTRLVLALLAFDPIAWLGSAIALTLFLAIRSGYQMILETAKLLALREELEAELERHVALRTIRFNRVRAGTYDEGTVVQGIHIIAADKWDMVICGMEIAGGRRDGHFWARIRGADEWIKFGSQLVINGNDVTEEVVNSGGHVDLQWAETETPPEYRHPID